MRNNNHASIEQPSVITSGYKTDLTQPSDERALLQFDLSKLPQSKQIIQATLNLYCIGVYRWDATGWQMLPSLNRIITLHRISTEWVGWSFTYWDYATYPHSPWKTPGGDYAPATASISFEIPFQWNEWIVTEDVKKWYNSEADNFGWLLKDANEGNSEGLKVEYMNWFYSFGVEDAPKLIIEMGNRQANLMFSPYLLIALYGLIISILFISRTIISKK